MRAIEWAVEWAMYVTTGLVMGAGVMAVLLAAVWAISETLRRILLHLGMWRIFVMFWVEQSRKRRGAA